MKHNATQPASFPKKYLWVVKLILAILLMYYLSVKGDLNLNILAAWAANINGLFVCCALFGFANIVLPAFRLKCFLRNISPPIGFRTTMRLSVLGNFFNAVLPGAVSGDFFKGMELKKVLPSIDLSQIFSFLFLDRAAGLASLIFLLTLSAVLGHEQMSALFGSSMIFWLLPTAVVVAAPTLWLIFRKTSTYKKALRRVRLFFLNSLDKQTLAKVFAFSALSQLSLLLALYVIATFVLTPNVRFNDLIIAFPLGSLAMHIPITPSGFGLGHVTYETLMQRLGYSNGANMANIYLITKISVDVVAQFLSFSVRQMSFVFKTKLHQPPDII